jgi:hypothetical protein
MAEGSLRASAPGEFASLRLVSAAHAFGSATVDLDTLAVGDVVIRIWFEVTTVYNAGTTNVITAGDGTTANKYLTSSDVTEGTVGVYPAGGAGPFKAETAAGTLRVTYAQTGTAATTGAGRCYALISSLPE